MSSHFQLLRAELKRIRNTPFFMGHPIDVRLPAELLLRPDYASRMLLPLSEFGHHLLILGISGAGKSRLLTALACHSFDVLRGQTCIDIAGDYVQSVLAHAARRYYETRDETILQRLHYLRPSYDWCFNLQPFAYSHDEIPPQHQELAFNAWRDAACDKVMRMAMRNNTSEEKDIMLRLKKWLRNVLMFFATPLPDGRRLSLADAFVMVDIFHPRHQEVFQKMRHLVPLGTQQDFERLHRMAKRPQDIDHYLESTDNRTSEFLKPFVETLLSRSDLPSLDYERIIRERHTVLVDLHETKYFSLESARVTADILINQLRDTAAECEERGKRTPHSLVIDETGAHVAEDLGSFSETMRKFGVSLCLSGQTLNTFRKGEKVDLTPEMLSLFRVISFQQRFPEDIKTLGEYFALPERILTERMQVMDRPDPARDEIVHLIDEGQAHSLVRASSSAIGRMQSDAWGLQIQQAANQGQVIVRSASAGKQNQENWSAGNSETDSEMTGAGHGTALGAAPIMVDGQLVQIPTSSIHDSTHDANGHARGRFDARGGGRGSSESWSMAIADSVARMFGRSWGRQHAEGNSVMVGQMQAEGTVFTRTVKQTLVPRTREEWHGTGQPRFSLPYQTGAFEFLLGTLPDRCAMFRTRLDGVERTLLFCVRDVPDVFSDPERERAIVRAFLERLYREKAYMFVPEAPSAARERRLQSFLAAAVGTLPTDGAPSGSSFR